MMPARPPTAAGATAASPVRVLRAGAAYFALVFAAGFALGLPRTLWLAPAVGAPAAVALELPLMLAVAWFASARLRRRWPLTRGAAACMGGIAFGLLMAAEAGLSVGLAGRSLDAHWALYRLPEHRLGLAGQLVFALIPLVQARRSPAARRPMRA